MKRLYCLPLIFMTFVLQAQQGEVFETVSKRLYDYYAAAPPEKIYIHQDRTRYMAGETMWFKAYQSVYPSSPVQSGVLYVELIDGANSPVIKSQWKLENGTAAGQMELPDSLQSGTYQLRAYTRWMQNFDIDDFFTREIHISSLTRDAKDIRTEFNLSDTLLSAVLRFPEGSPREHFYCLNLNGEDTERFSFELDTSGEAILDIDLPEGVKLEGTQYFVLETEDGNRMFPIPLTPAVHFTLFPEGGNLVTGLPSKIAFKVSDRHGKGLAATGKVLDESGKEIRRFQTQHTGYGSFPFIPEKDKKYVAVLDNFPVEISLPEVYASGLVMGVSYRDDRLRLTIRHNLDAKQAASPYFLTVRQESTTWFNARVDLSKPQSVVDIPYDKLPAGIFTITLFGDTYHVFAERLAFCNYPETLDMSMTTDKTSYDIRNKVTVQLVSPDIDTGSFSVAVIKTHWDDASKLDTYYSNFFLTSELKGRIEHPASYFDRQDSTSFQRLDLLLLTHGWRRYSWKDVMADKFPEITHLMENGLGFSGKVYAENDKQKAEDIEVTAVFRHDEIGGITPFNPAPDGSFMFTGYDFTDTAEVILSAVYRQQVLDISASEQARPKSDYYVYGEGLKDNSQSLLIDLYGTIPQLSGVGIDQRIHELPEVSVTAKKPVKRRFQYRIHNEEFVSRTYETINTYSYEISGEDGEGSLGAISILYHTPGVVVRGGGLDIRVSGTGAHIKSNSSNTMARPVEPIFLLDGTLTTLSVLRTMNAKLIDRVEVLNATQAMLYRSGAWGGAILFYTKDWDGMVYSTPSKTVSYKFPGYNQQKEFYSPDYSSGSGTNADHRNTLYWEPNVMIGEDGKAEFTFFTSDDKAEYLIRCEGRSEDGIIGVADTWFNTK